MMILERAQRVAAELPRARRVVAASHLFLGRASREERRHLIDERHGIRHSDAFLVEQHRAAASWTVHRRPWDDVLLSRVGDGGEPLASMISREELTDAWLLALARIRVAQPIFPEMGVIAEVPAE